jgi:protocatechuate 3,4-dioxygenase beta subunit
VTMGNLPPIPLATIAATPAASSLTPSVASFALGSVTDANGLYVLVGVPPGTVQIAAHHPMYPSVTSQPRRVGSGVTIEDWDLVFPAAGRLLAQVVDARSRPLGGVPVELRTDADDVPRTAITGYDGRVAFDGVSGIAIVTAMPAGRAAGRARAEVHAGATVELVIALEEARFALDGRVVDARGAPVEGARVEISSTRARALLEAFAITEVDGTFHLDALPAPPYRLLVDHPEFATTRLDDVRPREGRVEVRLVVGGVITGTLVDDMDDRPVPRVVVSLVAGDTLVDEDASDEAGRFQFERIAPGRYTLRMRPRDHLPLERNVTLAPARFEAPRLDVGSIPLRGAFVIRGRVTDALGDVVSRARITLPFTPGTSSVVTDAHGVFELRGVPPGTHELMAEHVRAGTARARRAVRGAAHEIVADIEVRLPGRLSVDDRTVDPAIVRGVAVVLELRTGGVAVAWVAPASAAEEAGLRVGDRLVTVDGESVIDLARAELLLRGPTDVPVDVVVERGAGERRFRTTREIYRPPPPELLRR